MFENSDIFYKVMYVVGFVIMMVYNIGHCKHYNLKIKEAIVYTLYTYFCGIVGAIIIGVIYNKVHAAIGIETHSSVAIFGAVIFTPILFLLFPITKENRKNALDMITPGVLEILACAKFGCFINGCCRGVVSDFGIQYRGEEVKYFPIQIIEVSVMLRVLFLTQLYFKRSKHYTPGTAYPITFAIYSVTRFISEFFRYYENPRQRDILFSMTFWQLICIFVILVSIFCVIILKKGERKKQTINNE